MADQGHSPTLTHIEVPVIITLTGVIPDHTTETVNAMIEVLHTTTIPVITAIAVIHHIKDHLHIEVLQHIQETTADPDPTLHINQVRKLSINLHSNVVGHQQHPQTEDTPES